MSEKLMKFMEEASKSEELVARIGNADQKTIIAIAREMGFELTEKDFENQPMELDDDDLDTVAGGTSVNCSCAMGGGGSKDENDKTCACVVAGFGYSKDGARRCFCALGGAGYDY